MSITACDKRIRIINDFIEGKQTVNCKYADKISAALEFLRERYPKMNKNTLYTAFFGVLTAYMKKLSIILHFY